MPLPASADVVAAPVAEEHEPCPGMPAELAHSEDADAVAEQIATTAGLQGPGGVSGVGGAQGVGGVGGPGGGGGPGGVGGPGRGRRPAMN